MSPLERAIEHFGSNTALAKAIGVVPMNVSHWINGRPVPVTRAIQIEYASGGAVKAAELRPDVFRQISAA